MTNWFTATLFWQFRALFANPFVSNIYTLHTLLYVLRIKNRIASNQQSNSDAQGKPIILLKSSIFGLETYHELPDGSDTSEGS